MSKTNIQPSKFEDLIGFIKQFMNSAASRLASRKELLGVVQNGRVLEEGGCNKDVRSQREERIVSGQVMSRRGNEQGIVSSGRLSHHP